MKKVILATCLLLILLMGTVAQAAQVPQLDQQIDIVADKAVTPLDYSFFDKPAPGRVELTDVQNLWGAGAQMIFYVLTDEGSDWLVLGFSGGMVEVKLQNKKIALFSDRVSSISASTPLVLSIQNGQLTASIGKRTRTVDKVTAFKGGLTTQSIEATLKAYRFVEK